LKYTFPAFAKWGLGLGILLLMLISVGKVKSNWQFNDDVARLIANETPISHKVFDYRQLDGLPEPVQLYFRRVLKSGQPYISNVVLSHTGFFKTDLKKDWRPIIGKEYFTADRPGFVWMGKTAAFTARDMFINGEGRLIVSLFSIIKFVDSQGPELNRGELMRWLGESVCFPTNLLPSAALKWCPIDERSARLEYSYQGTQINFMVTFNENHEIERMISMRNLGDGPRQKWVTTVSDYQLRDGVLIPMVLEAAWELPEGYFPYARFAITEIRFNQAL